jgi:undecaprenyl phosphate N,N'-diacetylbacillosamine 1-phosphate transferase
MNKIMYKNNKTLMRITKRIMDLILGFLSLMILLPFFIIIAILIKLDSNGPVFFLQERVGKDGKIFYPYKFRTMFIDAEKKGLKHKIKKNDERITKVGKYLRLGFDELPQIINVLKGEMSLIGPRPTLPYQIKNYSNYEKRRLEIKPGITGYALINGRRKLLWSERIKLDIWYIDNWSFWLDVKIIFKTFIVVLSGEGLYPDLEVEDKIVKKN